MPEGVIAENLLNNIIESLHDGGQKHKSALFFQEESESSVSAQFHRLFNPVDSMLWRNKKISAGVLVSATAIWVLFEWLNYNFLSLLCFALSFGMIAQFLWANASRVVLSLWAAGMIGSWCNFLTILYIGFVSAHTLPVLYERYEDEVDGFVYNALNKLQGHYKKLDSGVLSRIPHGSFRGKKVE
ncbi:hypothetical protein RND71_036606 [Anisodus tanguticus]|uniref:Reticulon-like protein n=1 Tax=Anisodus tanguticus TaxID=243964 RepID=A0AAE1R412_9SOLA|nr:hypothetical protein RND71_036606 [Anisodus tanguticus]